MKAPARWQKTHGVALFRGDLLSADSCVFWFSISVARATIATQRAVANKNAALKLSSFLLRFFALLSKPVA